MVTGKPSSNVLFSLKHKLKHGEKRKLYTDSLSWTKNKASLKQEIYRNTLAAFNELKNCGHKLINDLIGEMNQFDKDVLIECSENGDFGI